MALNLAIKFETPEEHFLKHKSPVYELPKFDPKSLSKTGDLCKPANAKLMLEQQEVDDNRYFAIVLKYSREKVIDYVKPSFCVTDNTYGRQSGLREIIFHEESSERIRLHKQRYPRQLAELHRCRRAAFESW